MKHPRRRFLHLAAGAAVLPFASRMASAQTYPTRPITMIVPFPAGGPTDVIARTLAEHMKVSLGQNIVVENIAGAGGSIGVSRAALAMGNGYTLSIGSISTHVMNGAVYPLDFDLQTAFEPISLLASSPLLIIGKKNLPAKDLKEFIAWLKANPDKASQGTFGAGNISHVAGIYFQRETGTRFAFVPYRGSPPAMLDLLAGQIDMMFDLAASAIPQVRAGAVKCYAVTAKTRMAAAPDIPTVDEAGLPGFYMSLWNGLWVPKGTHRDIVSKLNAAVIDALAHPSVRQRLTDLGLEIAPREEQTPEALRALQKAEIEKWWPIIKAAGVKAG